MHVPDVRVFKHVIRFGISIELKLDSKAVFNVVCLFVFTQGSSKHPQQERKATPTPREMSSTKSPLSADQTYERLLQSLGASAEMYRQIPLAFDPAALPRGIHIEPGLSAVCDGSKKNEIVWD